MSLTELLVVFAILAILGTIAFPRYTEFQQQARRIDATSALEHIATQQESFYVTNHRYTADLGQLGFAGNISDAGEYLLSVPVATDQQFQATAVPAPGSRQQQDAECQQFSITNTGVRTATPDPGDDCW